MPSTPTLHLLKPPDDPDARFRAILELTRRLTGREPSRDEQNATRRDLGLPPLAE